MINPIVENCEAWELSLPNQIVQSYFPHALIDTESVKLKIWTASTHERPKF